eukprot:jgi/Phyca11/118338/e_gw1.36.317.1
MCRLEIYCGKANANEDAVAQRAVVKNVTRVLQGQPSQRLICTDNFYTSIPLSDKLLSMGHYHVGTIRKDRKGWCKAIDFTQKKRPKKMARGTYRIAVWRDRPEFVALSWMDSKPVTFLATGCSTEITHVTLDIAMVNAFIIHKIALRRLNKPVPTHAVFMRRLHIALLSQTSDDFAGDDDLADLVTEPLPRSAHMLEKTEEKNGNKRRQ